MASPAHAYPPYILSLSLSVSLSLPLSRYLCFCLCRCLCLCLPVAVSRARPHPNTHTHTRHLERSRNARRLLPHVPRRQLRHDLHRCNSHMQTVCSSLCGESSCTHVVEKRCDVCWVWSCSCHVDPTAVDQGIADLPKIVELFL